MEYYTKEELDGLIKECNELFETLEQIEDGDFEAIQSISDNEIKEIVKEILDNGEDEKTLNEKLQEPIFRKISVERISDEDLANIGLDSFLKSGLLSFQWSNLNKQNQKRIIKVLEEVSYGLECLWIEIEPEIQKEIPKNFPTIIEVVKESPYMLRNILEIASSEVQNQNAELLSKIIRTVKENPVSSIIIWCNTTVEIQKANANLLPEIINMVKEDSDAVASIWENTTPEVQKANANLLPEIINMVKKDSHAVASIWANTTPEVKNANTNLLPEIINMVKEDSYRVASIWKNTTPEVQKANANLLPEIINMVKKDSHAVVSIWENTNKDVQKEKIDNIIEKVKENPDTVARIWAATNKDVQKEKIDNIIEKVKENPDTVARIWAYSSKDVQNAKADLLPNIIDMVKENPEALARIWGTTNENVQKEKIDNIIDMVKENPEALVRIWGTTNENVQKEKIDNIIDMVKENPYTVFRIWENTPPEVKKEGDNIKCFYKAYTGKEMTDEEMDRIKKLVEKNNNIFNTINYDLLSTTQIFKDFTEEQILRITNYPEVQAIIVKHYNNPCFESSIKYLMENDTNWIISLDKIIKNETKYSNLLNNLASIEKNDITEEFMQQFLSVMSDSENYFEINNYEDVNNFFDKRNEICLKILKGDTDNIPSFLKQHYNNDDLYKFALLKYQFGIDLKEAERLVSRYGKDSKELPESTLSDYLKLLQAIIECKDIENTVKCMVKENQLNESWCGFPDARNAEGQILNLFADLYNETLYKPKEEDKNNQMEMYTDKDGKQYKIDVYNISDDFNMNIRVEGAYRGFKEPKNFNDYYEIPNMDYHGNCESYIGNDSIAQARNIGGVAVGYSYIRKNNLTSAGPYDLMSSNRTFSIYNERSEFRIPIQMINHTRHTHNEMVKDRLVIDENGNVTKYKPDYAVWIEEDTKEERQAKDWQEKKDSNPKWIITKKLAAQLGIPIVVIDRERFAEREFDKIELMKNLITGKDVNDEKYKDYLEQYSSLSKSELIEQILIKFENNRTGIQFNGKLNSKFFTDKQLENLINEIDKSIEDLPSEESKKCLESLINVTYKEKAETEKPEIESFYTKIYEKNLEKFEKLNKSNEEKNKENLFELMDDISDTHYYDGNQTHSIEHIQKVILFSELLAERENLSQEDRKLLLVSAAFHDSGRERTRW